MTDQLHAEGTVFLFGPFRLIPARKLLLDGDTPVHVGNRALEILTALVERHGELVTRQELMSRAWPSAVVEDANLKVQIAALRKVLGEGPLVQRYLATAIGQGYRFVAPVQRETLAPDTPLFAEPARAANNLPAALVDPIGRSSVIQTLSSQLSRVRLVTVTGPGGIGKTTVALAVARKMAETGQHDVWFVDLSKLSDANLVPHAVATALGLAAHSDDILAALANYLRFRLRPQMFVLDNCEHVIEAAATTAESIVSVAPQMVVLATSREPLRAMGENVYRLEPLGSPVDSAALTASEALQYPAVQLFMGRAKASRNGFDLSDDDAPVVAEICRRLDGVALAIELAATRLDAFGVRGLLGLLDDRFRALGHGRRTAPERHRTLSAMLDWSHQLLSKTERVVLRRLGAFAAAFPLASAIAVAADEDIDALCVTDTVAGLVAKSMVSADVSGETVRYRLLDSTREYARHRLAESGELNTVARRHAQHFCAMYAEAGDLWSLPPNADWLDEHVHEIDDVRAALNWAFSPQGDSSIGIELTVSAIPAWLHLSSLEECRSRVERALSMIVVSSSSFDNHRMKLQEALAASTLYTRGMVPEVDAAWKAALEIAEKLDSTEYRLRSLFVACCGLVYAGKHRAADEVLQKFRRVAAEAGDTVALSDGDRLTAYASHCVGKHATARLYLERVLNRHDAPLRRPQLSRFHADWRVAALTIMTNVLWIQGFPQQALRVAQEARNGAKATGHAMTLGYVLVLASVPIALHVGDLDQAEAMLKVLREHLAKHGLVLWDSMARCLYGVLLIQRHDVAGLPTLAGALDKLRREHFGMRYSLYLGIFAQGLLSFGRHIEARPAIEDALRWANAHEELWCLPELLRIKGEILEANNAFDTQGATESLYMQAIELARHQGARSLELRAAMNLARLKHRLGKVEQAEALLTSVYEQFTEGFETVDLKAARALLECFRRTPGREPAA